MQKLTHSFKANGSKKKKITREILKDLGTNKNNTSKIMDAAKAVLRRNFTAINASLKKYFK